MAVDFVTYQWLVDVHIFGVFVFLIAHGVSAGVGFPLAKERNRERLAALLEFSGSSYRVMILGFWWILITGLILMTPLAAIPYNRVRAMLGIPAPMRRKKRPTASPGSDDELAAALAKIPPIPAAAVGVVGLAVLLYLMLFKPL